MGKLLNIGVPAESVAGERRVALVPNDAAKLVAGGFAVLVERRAGLAAGFSDAEYAEIRGVKMVTPAAAWKADLVLHVQPPQTRQVAMMRKDATLISHVFASNHRVEVKALLKHGVHSLAMDLIPRISRAQSIDSLSSQATVSGYWSVLHAAASCPVFFPMITYAAGTIRPAKMLVIGAGVAGLQAVATARRLGAVVEAFDVRPETREQIASLGAKPVDLGFDASGEGGYARELTKAEQTRIAQVLTNSLARVDVVIATAGVPGKPSPVIITREQVEQMQPGSLIVDAVAESGGNCVLNRPGKLIIHKGVHISGPVHIASNMPKHASEMYSRNLMGMIGLLIRNGQVVVDSEDEIVSGCLLTSAGKAMHQTIESLQTEKPARRTRAVVKNNTSVRARSKPVSRTGSAPTKSRNRSAGRSTKT